MASALNQGTKFSQSGVDPCILYIITDEIFVVMAIHVDDYLIATNSPEWYADFMEKFGAAFQIVDLGEVNNLMQIHVNHTEGTRSY